MIRRSLLSRWSSALILLAAPALHAQTAELVKDILDTRDVPPISSFPQQLRTVGGKLFFVASSTGEDDDEVWVTDGTAVGTEMLVDFCPLGCAADPRWLGSIGNLLFFIAWDEDISGFRLWRSDGTRAGTFPLTGSEVSLHPEDGESVVAGGVLYFQGCGGGAGCELWRSDGTVAGTRILADLEPGSESSEPVELTAAGSRIFFLDDDGDLWRSDGTESGTTQISDLPPRTAEDQRLFAAGQRLFFFAIDDRGPELWGSDGTAAGTLPLTRFAAPDPFPPEAYWLKAIGNRVYFRADDGSQGEELWVSDGTAQGTRRVTGFSNPRPFAGGLSEFEVEELAGQVIFYATDGVTPRTLWSSAGSPASTALLCRPKNCPTLTSSFLRPGLVKAGSRIIFSGSDPEHGFEPWATDGTAQGTARLQDLCPGTCDGLPDQPVALLGAAFFTANRGGRREIWRTDGTVPGTRRWTDPGPFLPIVLEPAALGRDVFFIANDDHGVELWMSDGQPGGTRLVADLGRFAAGGLFMDQRFQALGGRLLFTACSAAGSQLWQSGGTAETTTPLSLAPPSPPFPLCDFASSPRGLTVAGALAYFELELSRSQLWRTDGTPAGTILLAELPEDASLSGGTLTPLGNRVLFAVDGQGGFELWTSDGTPAGTGKFFDLPCCSRAGFFAAVGSEVYFSVGQIVSEVWRTDGTAAGTRRVSDEGAFWNHARHFIRFGSAVLFFAFTDTASSSPRLQLWKTDGTPAGTVPVSPSIFGSSGIEASPLLELQGALYFLVAKSATASNGLWRTDGTETGTRLVRELPESFPGTSLVAFAGRFFFAAGDAAHGVELWQSDGTAAGTSLVRDIFPGVESSRPSELTIAGGRLFFVARDRFHGTELWQTDGTEAGTRLVQDLAPAGASSEPRALTVAGDRLFFSADDGVFGRELWALPLGGNAGCRASSSRLCLNGGRFQVEVTWKAANGLTGAGRAVPLTGDTGTFWFFDPANVELVVKVLDGRPLNGHFWVFYGALSDVEYTLTVTDTQTGASRRYLNLSGRMASVGDTRAFGPLGAFSSAPGLHGPALVAERHDPAAIAPCQPDLRRLCLNQGRFAVEATWKDFQDHTGDGTAVGLTGDTGYFWFFDPANVEVVLKILDGRSLNGKFWVFYGALSNVEYTLHVTDTETGIVRTYTNPRGRFASVADTGAF